MDKGKLIDVIEADYIKGQRKGKIFSFVITAIVPLCLLVVVFASIVGISNQYVSAKQELQSEIENKQEELVTKEELLEDKDKQLEDLKEELNNYLTVNNNLKNELLESKVKYKKLDSNFEKLKKRYSELISKGRQGFKASVVRYAEDKKAR